MEVNIWKKFVGLIPGGSRTIGLVMSVNTTAGTSTVQLRDGSEFTATGTSVTAGQNAIVTDGVVVGKAPSLPQYSVTV